jgi:elongation factor G
VSYREGLRGVATASAIVDTPLGGQPQFAEVMLEVAHFANQEPGRVAFASAIAPDELPRDVVDAVRQAALDAASGGVLRGDPMIDVRVTLLSGVFREGESAPAAFARATAMAFCEAARKAIPRLLEPIMRFEVACPEEFLGGVLKDLQMRGAEVREVATREDRRVVTGRVAFARMFQYAGIVRSLTQGRGSCSLEPSEYGEVSRQDYVRLVGE